MAVQTKAPAGNVSDFARKTFRDVQVGTEKRVRELIDRGESYGKEGLEALRKRFSGAFELSEDLFQRARGNAEWFQHRIEEGVQGALERLNVPSSAELERLEARVAKLESKLGSLERKLRRQRRTQKSSTKTSRSSSSRSSSRKKS